MQVRKCFVWFFLHLRAIIENEKRREKKRANEEIDLLLELFFSFSFFSLSHSLFHVSNNVVSCFRLDKYTYTSDEERPSVNVKMMPFSF
jgi:hypothetical protein